MIERVTEKPAQTIRSARPDEVDAILALFADEVRAGLMLPRNPDNMRKGIDDWLVATDTNGEIIGCVSLVAFNDELCEVRSLAVHPDTRGNGLGAALVRAAIFLAVARGMKRVLTLTRAAGLFEGLGFRRDAVANFPEKVWTDCAPCPLKDRCDEIALVYFIDEPTKPNGKGRNGHSAS